MGNDSTRAMRLSPGPHEIRVENGVIGSVTRTITILDGQTGVIVIEW